MSSEQSIRNQVPGTIKKITSDKVLTEVTADTAAGEMSAVITTHSVEQMGIKVGDPITLLIKATSVSIQHRA